MSSKNLEGMSSRRLQDMSSRRLQDMSSRHVFKKSSRHLQRNNFSSSNTSSRHLARCLQDVKTFWKTKNCYAEDILRSYAKDMSWRRLQDQQMFARKYLMSLKSNITYIFSHNNAKIKVNSYDILAIEKHWLCIIL